jgi:ArsR family transcriptional regulator, arsenate/arsenite/antimonite-responsive transcriptional repressor / arsenate reductase (thioredoxin)
MMMFTDRATPVFVRLAAHPVRWRLLSELAVSDRRVRELVELAGQPQNLISYHLGLLRGGGLVNAHRSSFDARDSYYHLNLEGCVRSLDAVGLALHPALRLAPTPPFAPNTERSVRPRVLFTCTGNSARSLIAEALLRNRAGGHVEVVSAGSHPKAHIHPNAARVLREHYGGIDIADHVPRHLDTVARRRFDYVITLCDKVREVCPEFVDQPRLIHWSIPDPAASDTNRKSYPAFRRTAAEIDTRIRYLLAVLAHTPNRRSSRDNDTQ